MKIEDMTMVEMIQSAGKKKSFKAKVEELKKFDIPAMRMFLKAAYDPKIKWLLPDGEVPYTPSESPLGDGHKFLQHDIKILLSFVENGDETLKQFQRENRFVQTLEALHESEALLLISAKNRSVDVDYKLSDKVVKAAMDWNDEYFRNV
jgi:hypothetical protein